MAPSKLLMGAMSSSVIFSLLQNFTGRNFRVCSISLYSVFLWRPVNFTRPHQSYTRGIDRGTNKEADVIILPHAGNRGTAMRLW